MQSTPSGVHILRNLLFGFTPFVVSLAVFAQAAPAPKPAAPAGPAAPAHPLTVAQAHEIMQLTGTAKIKQQLTDNMLRYFEQSFPPFMPKDVMVDMKDSLAKADIDTPVVAIYQQHLSTEAAVKVIEFYKTPAGHELIEATPLILGDAQKTALATGQKIAHDVIERHRPEIEAAQKTYQAQHAAPAPGAGAAPAPKQ